MFAYCGNNPVNRSDPTGEAWWHWAIGAAIVAACAIATVVTAGGFAAAAGAVAMVGNGIAASTTATTVAASAFIGSATAYGTSVLMSASVARTPQEFSAQGNWGTVAVTAGGAVLGGWKCVYLDSHSQNKDLSLCQQRRSAKYSKYRSVPIISRRDGKQAIRVLFDRNEAIRTNDGAEYDC